MFIRYSPVMLAQKARRTGNKALIIMFYRLGTELKRKLYFYMNVHFSSASTFPLHSHATTTAYINDPLV